MLVNLFIQNFILIEEISLDLSGDFNVFTGETGAGKSLFVDALNFVSGERSTASIVGPYGDRSLVEAVFLLKENDDASIRLQEMGFESEDGIFVFSREMQRNGRSTSRINRRIVTLKEIRDVLSLTLDIHSQHDTHLLLNQKNHLNLLQSFIKDTKELDNYKKTYQSYLAKKKEISTLKESILDGSALEFAKFLLKDIQTLNPTLDDYETLDTSLKQMENYDKHKQDLTIIDEALGNGQNILGNLHALLPYFEKLDTLTESFNDVYYQLEDITHQISIMNNDYIFDEYEFQKMNDRMLSYTKLIRKYGPIEVLLDKKDELELQIKQAENFDDYLVDLNNELKVIEDKLIQEADSLHKSRVKEAKTLEKEVLKELHDLSLENAVFKIQIDKITLSPTGFDDVYFMISMNKGMPLAHLDKVASGGELSRVMLGLKVVFSTVQSINTLIFDEIDTGVSGAVAFRIGEKMREIAKTKQVIAITHLPAVAVCAQNHYLITKDHGKDTSKTHVYLMDDSQRIEHLAIMMMGSINEESLAAAKNLLEKGVD